MKNRFKKLFTFALALALSAVMSISVFAASGTGYYLVGSPVTTTDPITVKVVIESKQYTTGNTTSLISEVLDVTVS